MSCETNISPQSSCWLERQPRHGFESYSFRAQYNLLAASMLATAWYLADETIGEGAAPAELGGFAIELPTSAKSSPAGAARVLLNGSMARVQLDKSVQVFRVEVPSGVSLRRTGQWIRSRNGFLEAIEGEVHGRRVVYTLTPERCP